MLQIIQNCWCFLLNVQIPILYTVYVFIEEESHRCKGKGRRC